MMTTDGDTRHSTTTNGHYHAYHDDLESSGKHVSRPSRLQRIHFRTMAIIEDFSLFWFVLTMNTGILSIVLHQNPYQFDGIGILATIMFVFNLVLFVTFSGFLIARIVLFPRSLFKSLTTNLTELALTAAVPISFFTIVAQVGITASTARWGGHSWMLVAYVLWWIGTAFMTFVASFVMIMVAKYQVVSVSQLNPALAIPFVGTATDGVVGALITTYSSDVTASIAVPVIVVSYLMAGIGFFVALLVFSAYLNKLLDKGLPPAKQSPSLFLLIAPPGQTASALLLLGAAAQIYFPSYMEGTVLNEMGGTVFAVIGVLLGLLFLGFASFFSIFAIFQVLEAAFKRQHEYSLIWWSVIFPLATVNTAWISLANAMNSDAFRVLSSIFLIALFVAYFVNWGFTLYYIFDGRLLHGKKSGDPVMQQEKWH